MKVTSADCKNYIIKTDYPFTSGSDWKRKSKRKEGADVIRVFSNAVLGRLIAVIERNGEIYGSMDETSGVTVSLTTQLLANPITVDLKKADTSGTKDELEEGGYSDREIAKLLPKYIADFSGRIVWGPSDEDEETEDEDHEVGFSCGPETKDGSLHDTFDGNIDPKLKILFEDFPIVNDRLALTINAAENYHELQFPDEMKACDVRKIIKIRLERSGAVRPKGW